MLPLNFRDFPGFRRNQLAFLPGNREPGVEVGQGEDAGRAGRAPGMVAAVSEVLPLPERSLNNWHEGVWGSVCVRAPVWCVRGRGWGEGYKAGGGYYYYYFFAALHPIHPTHPSRVEKPVCGQPTLDSTLPPPGRWGVAGWGGGWGCQGGSAHRGAPRRTGPRVAIVA